MTEFETRGLWAPGGPTQEAIQDPWAGRVGCRGPMCTGKTRSATETRKQVKPATPTLGVMSLDPSAGGLRKARPPGSQKPQQEWGGEAV